jgi:hypothetical protein
VTAYELSLYQRLIVATGDLVVAASLVGLVATSWDDAIQMNWQHRIEDIISRIESETEQLQEFGEAFDDIS